MKRTQIYIPEETHFGAQIIADRLDVSVAEIYRNYIEEGLKKEGKRRGSASALLNLKITGGPKDLSKNHTKYLFD